MHPNGVSTLTKTLYHFYYYTVFHLSGDTTDINQCPTTCESTQICILAHYIADWPTGLDNLATLNIMHRRTVYQDIGANMHLHVANLMYKNEVDLLQFDCTKHKVSHFCQCLDISPHLYCIYVHQRQGSWQISYGS